MASFKELYRKYDIPAPRYTSYPTVPFWSETPTPADWIQHLRRALKGDQTSWALYVHLPYCETLCTFCGCNTSITKDHAKERPYVDLVIRELDLYLQNVPELKTKPLRQIHFGGGSPTFFSAEALGVLVDAIDQRVRRDSHHFEGAIEVDPRRTKHEQLQALKRRGFNRISLGVQDFDPEVQRLVNRIQPFEQTQQVTQWARDMGYESVNFDLIYGLAKQTPDSITRSAQLTVALKPDRIALYSLAIVPWIKPQQRLFKDEDLPKGEDKRKLYEIARAILTQNGYVEIGMDHFALSTDALYEKTKSKQLHRNFMGYTDQKTDVLLGLGVSSISETPESFHQNEKVLNLYEQKISKNEIPTLRGHVLTDEDKTQRWKILKFMTQFEVLLSAEEKTAAEIFLKEMILDGLVEIQGSTLKLTDLGRPFLRNAAVFFDSRLQKSQPQTRIFSQSI
ncbi:MAG: oxygen-independent coproporphyrinogen III oxidase [Bdellovibrionaceae bacterium]|nr:oxygen-independent coproporphyrinogen III oxidase [Pseudobdellovibrionaceae bacterium]